MVTVPIETLAAKILIVIMIVGSHLAVFVVILLLFLFRLLK